MTKQNVNPNPPAPGAASGAQGGESPLAAQLAKALGAGEDGSGSGGSPVEAASEIEVDYGGTPRKMKVSDLVSAHQKAEELSQLQSVLDRKLKLAANLESYQALQETLDRLTPEKKARLQQFLQEQDDEGAGDDGDEIERAIREEAGASKQKGQIPDPVAKRLSVHEETLKAILTSLQARQQQEQRQTFEQQLASQMAAFPVLEADAGMKSFLLRSIQAQHAADPSVPVESLVSQAAKVAQGLVDGARSGVLTDIEGSPNASLPTKKFSGEDMSKGRIADHLQTLLRAR